MKSYRKVLKFFFPTRRGLENITEKVQQAIDESGVREGLVLVNAMNITASIFINDDGWRPPSKSVSRKASVMALARSGPMMRSPRHSTLAPLCRRLMRAMCSLAHRAARMPFTRLAAMDMPMPDPQMRMPKIGRAHV